MRYLNDFTELNETEATVLTLGKFDGIHKGHRLLLDRLFSLSEAKGLKKAVFTFDVSPQAKIAGRNYRTLLTNEERKEVFEELGIDVLLECRFDDIRGMEAEAFVRDIIVEGFKAKAVACGSDFRFGKDRRGDCRMLTEMGNSLGFSTVVLEKEAMTGHEISSTDIRKKLEEGDIASVNSMLSYNFFVSGRIVHGAHLGTGIGFPTINLIPPNEKLLPPKGVYESITEIDGISYESITNIGTKPTVDGSFMGVETYIYGFDKDVYGKNAKVSLLRFTRPEKKFASVEELKAQLMSDTNGRLKL